MSINVLKKMIETPIDDASDMASEMMSKVNEENCFLLIKISDCFNLGIKEDLQNKSDAKEELKMQQEEDGVVAQP